MNTTPAAADTYDADRKAARAAARYTHIRGLIEADLLELNELLGLADERHKASFGYIGNISIRGDESSWYVFLPHPGRPGTSEDRIGGFPSGDLAGISGTYGQLHALIKGVKLARRF